MIRINQKVYRIIYIMVVCWFWRWVKSSNEVTQNIKKTVSSTTPQTKKEPTKVWIIPQHQETPGINVETRESAFEVYSWFSHDETKIQTKKLPLLLSFYFHVILEHLKAFIQKHLFGSTEFLVLRYRTFEFPDFCVTSHLAGGRESSYVG